MIKILLCSLFFSNLLWADVIDRGEDVETDLKDFQPTVSENSISFPGEIKILLDRQEIDIADIEDYKQKFFQVFLNKGSYTPGSSPLAKGGEGGVINKEIKHSPTDKSAVWEGVVTIEPEPEVGRDDKHIITITNLRITKSEKSSTSIFTDGQSEVTLSFGISENGRDSVKATSITVKNTIAYPEQSSTVIEVEDRSYAGYVRWENPEITYFADTEGKIKTSNSVLVMAIRNEGDSEDDINVKYFPKTEDGAVPDPNPTLTAAKCKFDPVGKKIKCDINDDEYWWFVDSVQDESSTFKMVVVPADKSEAVVGGLLSGFSYSVILQYKRGLSRTDYATITPVETIALGEKHELGDPRCFVVSAAFGSSFAKHIDIFRWFRDEFLLTNSLGEDLVNYYYKTSPPFADYVAESSALKTILRTVLFPLAGVLYLLQFALSYYWIVLLLALAYFSRNFFVRFS